MRLVTMLTPGFRPPPCPCPIFSCGHAQRSGALGYCNQELQCYNISYYNTSRD